MTAKQLADALEINIRTVYRYIDALCASGAPIISDSGHNGGYSLLPHFQEAPLLFDLDEQKALVHAAAFAKESGYPFSMDLSRAIAKLKRYANEEQRHAIDRHQAGFDVIAAPVDPSLKTILQELEACVASGYSLLIDYQKNYQTAYQKRRIDPYGLVHWKANWYIVAYCHLRSDIRSFRVDRIGTIERTNLTFERPADFSARHFFLTNLLPAEGSADQLVSIRITGRPQAITDLCNHWFLSHTLVERSSDCAHFRIDEKLVHTQVPHFLLAFGKSVQVREPTFLRERLAAIAADLLAYYQSP